MDIVIINDKFKVRNYNKDLYELNLMSKKFITIYLVNKDFIFQWILYYHLDLENCTSDKNKNTIFGNNFHRWRFYEELKL